MTNLFPVKILRPQIKLFHTEHALHYWVDEWKQRLWYQTACQFFDRIVCVSDYVNVVLQEKCPWARKKLRVIYNGVDLNKFRPTTRQKDLGKLRIIAVSRISSEKNLLAVLRACLRLKERGVPFELKHVGSGSDSLTKQLSAFVVDNNLSDAVEFLGFQDDVGCYFDMADVFVSASLTEAHPVAVLEAMAMEKLVLVSDIPSHRLIPKEGVRIFAAEENGLVDLLEEAFNNPQKFDSVPQIARTIVKDEFSLERMVLSYRELYES